MRVVARSNIYPNKGRRVACKRPLLSFQSPDEPRSAADRGRAEREGAQGFACRSRPAVEGSRPSCMSLAAGLLARHIRRRIGRGRWVRPGCRSSRGRARIRGVAERRRILQVGLGHVQHGTIRVAPADRNRSAILLYNASSRVGRRAGCGRDRRNRVGRGRAWHGRSCCRSGLGRPLQRFERNGDVLLADPEKSSHPDHDRFRSAVPVKQHLSDVADLGA
jgi:hypothetical protein